jgi:hypothetical protein
MRAFWRIIGWPLLGALLAGTFTCAGFLLLNSDQLLAPKDTDEIQTWARFSAIMGSLALAAVGFVSGAVYAIVRRRGRPAE